MNETKKKKERKKEKKTTTKSVHITLLALLLIQVFVFIISYYSDMFMIWFSGKYNVGYTGGRALATWENRDVAHIRTYTHIMYSLYGVYELACAYSTRAFCLSFFFKERFANSALSGVPSQTLV